MQETDIKQILQKLLSRTSNTNKYDYGHILVIGGSLGMTGAPLLAAQSAMRSGAGLVTIASRVANILQTQVLEIMTHQVAEDDSQALTNTLKFIEDRHVTNLIIGPGLPANDGPFIYALLAQLKLPTVLDAGGLSTFNGQLELLKGVTQHNSNIILTPHAGEYKKLTGGYPPQAFSSEYNLTLALKGQPTNVYGNSNHYENNTGNPGLATAGTGDVLSGVIAALSGQGLSPFEAASAGVYLHGLAGDLAAADKTQPAMIASDVIDHLPKALLHIG